MQVSVISFTKNGLELSKKNRKGIWRLADKALYQV